MAFPWANVHEFMSWFMSRLFKGTLFIDGMDMAGVLMDRFSMIELFMEGDG